jgi:hypothetical protein
MGSGSRTFRWDTRLRKVLLAVDAAINVILGSLLLEFPPRIVILLGVPPAESKFYPNILGAVLVGIGIALVIQSLRRPGGPVGLGLAGAMAVNLSGGIVLAAWLVFGRLDLPIRGRVFLGSLAAILIVISVAELLAHIGSADKGRSA